MKRIVIVRIAAPAALVLALGGCSWWSGTPREQARYPADATFYKCAAGKQLVVRYLDGGKAAMVMYPDRDFRLNQVPAASGVRYTNGRTTLHTQGEGAFVEEGDNRPFDDCKRVAK